MIGDGAVGLSAVLAARRLGAEQIILMGRHADRTDLGREFGATDVVAERGEEGIAKVRELTGGDGTHVGAGGRRPPPGLRAGRRRGPRRRRPSAGSASRSTRTRRSASAACSAATSPSPAAPPRPAPTSRNCCPTVLDGTIEPGQVFDRTVGLDEVPDGYRAMDDREAIKVLVTP